jgi:peptidoglycan/LPS O-acetylase OafA/YrhL
MNRIPTLDGWRGIAILLVLFDHFQDSLVGHYAAPWAQTGQHGVTIFFVLSGFLITSKLMEGPIDLKRFYLRRFFRLMPAAWTYLAMIIIVDRFTGAHLTSLPGVVACLLFFRNFSGNAGGGVTGHFWSLSLEEQFYLVWPWILLLAGVRRCRWIAAAGAIACAAYRWFNWEYYNRNLFNGESQVRADALLAGCLLALLLADARIRSAFARWSKFFTLPALVAMLFCIARFHWMPPLFECVAIAALIAATALHPASVFARPLSFPALAWLGTISYSLYLWQEFFTLFQKPVAMFVAMPIAALASYYLIERPCVRFGHRITRPELPAPDEVVK